MLLVRGSLSKARAILKDTLHGIKSLFSTGYQRLPKAPPFSCGGGNEKQLRRSFRELENFYDDVSFSQRQYYEDQNSITTAAMEEKKNKMKKCREKKYYLRETEEINTGLIGGGGGGGGGERLSDDDEIYSGSFMGFAKMRPRPSEDQRPQLQEREREHEKRRSSRRGGAIFKEEGEDEESFSDNLRVELCCTVAEALKKLEQLDASNVEHVLDIEEVRHYYSRINCPFYIDIFNKFFLETYTDFLPAQTSQTTCRFCHRR